MLAQDDTSLEPSWPKMSPRIDFSLICVPFWGFKMHQKSIQKPNNFQTSLETLFSANRVHKSSKMRGQSHSKIKPFLGRIKNRESCSRLDAGLVCEVLSNPKSHVFFEPFAAALDMVPWYRFFRDLSRFLSEMGGQRASKKEGKNGVQN